MGSAGGALGGGVLAGGSLTGGAPICCALGGRAPTRGALTGDVSTRCAFGGDALTGGASICCALGGAAPTCGGFTRGAGCADRESTASGPVGSPASGRSMSSVANRLAKKAVSAKTISAGVSIFWADASAARLLESGGRFLDMGNG